MPAALIALGAVLLVVGAAMYDFRAAVLVAGALAVSAGLDLARPGRSS